MIFIGPQIKLGLIKLLGHRPAAVGGLSWGLRRSQKQHLESCERLHEGWRVLMTPGPTGFVIAGLCASWRSWLVLSLESLVIAGISIVQEL